MMAFPLTSARIRGVNCTAIYVKQDRMISGLCMQASMKNSSFTMVNLLIVFAVLAGAVAAFDLNKIVE